MPCLFVDSQTNSCYVHEGLRSAVLVVNSSGAPVRLGEAVLLTDVFSYGISFSSASLDSSSLSVGAVADTPMAGESSACSSTDHFKMVDYPNLRQCLLETFHKYRAAIALPGESLDTTTLTKDSININPNTTPVCIPAYRLPHRQRKLVYNQIKHMLDQGVIQHSRSPWNSPLFILPQNDEVFRPVIGFRRLNYFF